MERPTDGNPIRNQIADPLETGSHHTSESPAADKHLERAGRASGRGIWIPLTVVSAAVVGFLLWQRMATPAKTADRPSEKPSLPADVILLNDQQFQQISTDVVKERLVSIDRKATGKIAFNEERLTPVFTPFSGRIVELLANRSEEHTSELQSRLHLVCRLLLEKKNHGRDPDLQMRVVFIISGRFEFLTT